MHLGVSSSRTRLNWYHTSFSLQFNPRTPVTVDPAIAPVVATMKETPDILRAVKQCQATIASFTGPTLLPSVCSKLIYIAENMTPPRPELVMVRVDCESRSLHLFGLFPLILLVCWLGHRPRRRLR